MARCLEMSQQGKISKANCWQLDFIESLPALVGEEANAGSLNLHNGRLGKLGMSIGVASAVYGYRVDSLLDAIYNTLDSKSKESAETSEGVSCKHLEPLIDWRLMATSTFPEARNSIHVLGPFGQSITY
jgi:hypothetical protein